MYKKEERNRLIVKYVLYFGIALATMPLIKILGIESMLLRFALYIGLIVVLDKLIVSNKTLKHMLNKLIVYPSQLEVLQKLIYLKTEDAKLVKSSLEQLVKKINNEEELNVLKLVISEEFADLDWDSIIKQVYVMEKYGEKYDRLKEELGKEYKLDGIDELLKAIVILNARYDSIIVRSMGEYLNKK